MSVDLLQRLVDRCKATVHVEINQHRGDYQTAEAWLSQQERREWVKGLDPDVRAEMVKRDTIIELQFYPDTPIGFFVVWHHDLRAALEEALACLDAEAAPTAPVSR